MNECKIFRQDYDLGGVEYNKSLDNFYNIWAGYWHIIKLVVLRNRRNRN
jgi:hypothetical protein